MERGYGGRALPRGAALVAAAMLCEACTGVEGAATERRRPPVAEPAEQPPTEAPAAPRAGVAARAQVDGAKDLSLARRDGDSGRPVAVPDTSGAPGMGGPTAVAAEHVGSRALVKLTDLEVERFGGAFAEWHDTWTDSSVMPITFRWSSGLQGIGSARWEVSDGQGRLVAEGDAGAPPAAGTPRLFSIDFRDVVESQERPLSYVVEVRTFDPSGASELGPPSDTNVVTFLAPGAITHFTEAGLNPELYSRMPIRIDLDTLEIEGEGSDEDPYLFLAAIYADGTTVVPYVDWTTREVHFPSSEVRVETKGPTHENVPGGDAGDVLVLPDETGRFETVVRPIGTRLAGQLGLGADQMLRLREGTQVAVVAIGFEEDALPSTDVVDELRAAFVARLHDELTRIVLDLRVAADGGGLTLPDLGDATDELQERLTDELTALAEQKGLAEVAQLLMLPAWPMVFAQGGANPDDYIGHGRAIFTYEQILQAGTAGLPIELRLHQNCKCGKPRYLQNDLTETIAYRIRGSVRFVLD